MTNTIAWVLAIAGTIIFVWKLLSIAILSKEPTKTNQGLKYAAWLLLSFAAATTGWSVVWPVIRGWFG